MEAFAPGKAWAGDLQQRLWDAMVAAQNKQKPDRSRAAYTTCSTVQGVKQGEFVGLLKYMLGN